MSPQLSPDEQVLMALDKALKAELTAVHQYLLHSRMCQSWGYSRLAEYNRKESLEELEHAGLLIDRILVLQGTPNVTELLPISNADDVRAQMEVSLALEKDAVTRLNAAVKHATEAGDNVTRQLFDKILLDEDHHVDYLESQLHVIGDIGLESYLARQIDGKSA
jgi:bacterioferritin